MCTCLDACVCGYYFFPVVVHSDWRDWMVCLSCAACLVSGRGVLLGALLPGLPLSISSFVKKRRPLALVLLVTLVVGYCRFNAVDVKRGSLCGDSMRSDGAAVMARTTNENVVGKEKRCKRKKKNVAGLALLLGIRPAKEATDPWVPRAGYV